MTCYLAIDLGTTGCRSILFDARLQPLGSAYEEYGLILPQDGWVEQDALGWWEMTKRTALRAAQNAGIPMDAIRSIGISSQGITVVPTDEHFAPLCNALSWLDVRSTSQTEEIIRTMGREAVFRHTGKPADPSYTLPKLLWLRREQPELFHKARWFLMPMDFLIAKLTGRCVTDHSMASGTLLYDLANCCWSEACLKLFGIPKEKLPPILPSGTAAGTVLPEVAQQLGLRPDCTVAVGAQDQKCAALGVGLDAHSVTVSLGTACAITRLWDRPATDEVTNVGWCGYTEPGCWVTEGVVNTAGTCLRWVRDLLFPGEDYAVINREAEAALKSGSKLLFFPYLNGTHPDATGVFHGVTLGTNRGCFAAAVMEGVAFRIRTLLEAMEAATDDLILFGGGANSPLWCRILADVTGMTVRVPSTAEAAGAGAAILAARAAGERLPPLQTACSYAPGVLKAHYETRYATYRQTEKKLFSAEP